MTTVNSAILPNYANLPFSTSVHLRFPNFLSFAISPPKFIRVVSKLQKRVKVQKEEASAALAELAQNVESLNGFFKKALGTCDRLNARAKVEFKEIRAKVSKW